VALGPLCPSLLALGRERHLPVACVVWPVWEAPACGLWPVSCGLCGRHLPVACGLWVACGTGTCLWPSQHVMGGHHMVEVQHLQLGQQPACPCCLQACTAQSPDAQPSPAAL